MIYGWKNQRKAINHLYRVFIAFSVASSELELKSTDELKFDAGQRLQNVNTATLSTVLVVVIDGDLGIVT